MANITRTENAEWIYFVTLEKAVLVWGKTKQQQNKCHHWQKKKKTLLSIAQTLLPFNLHVGWTQSNDQ